MTSAIAAPAYAGIPVTHRDFTSSVTIFTGHEDPTKPETALDYARLAALPGTKVMLMGVERMGPITAELQKHGMLPETPIALVRWGHHREAGDAGGNRGQHRSAHCGDRL